MAEPTPEKLYVAYARRYFHAASLEDKENPDARDMLKTIGLLFKLERTYQKRKMVNRTRWRKR